MLSYKIWDSTTDTPCGDQFLWNGFNKWCGKYSRKMGPLLLLGNTVSRFFLPCQINNFDAKLAIVLSAYLIDKLVILGYFVRQLLTGRSSDKLRKYPSRHGKNVWCYLGTFFSLSVIEKENWKHIARKHIGNPNLIFFMRYLQCNEMQCTTK